MKRMLWNIQLVGGNSIIAIQQLESWISNAAAAATTAAAAAITTAAAAAITTAAALDHPILLIAH